MSDNLKKEKHAYDKNLELLKRIKQGEGKIINELIENNLGLVSSISRKFNNRGIEFDDIFQIGSLGLLKAALNFDDKYKVKFSTYAVPMIIGEIKRFLRDDGIIKISRSLKSISKKVNYSNEKLSKILGRTPTIAEISEDIDISSEDIIQSMESNSSMSYLYDTIHKSDGTPVLLIDKISNKNGNDNIEDNINNIMIKKVLKDMNEEHRKVIMLRYYKDKTQSEVAKMLGISQVQVSRMEKRILRGMREYFEDSVVDKK